jgi:hypothetical protein
MRFIRYLLVVLVVSSFFGCASNSKIVRPVSPVKVETSMEWPSFVPHSEVAMLNVAEKRIAQLRQGDLIVTVKDAWGRPANGVKVAWTQVSKDFRFGVDAPFEPTVWADLNRIGINHSVAELDWRNTQPRIGDILVDEQVKAWGLNVFPGQRNSSRAAGVVWLRKDRMPDWFDGLTGVEQVGAIDWHLTRLAERLRGQVSVWEVLREPTSLSAGALEKSGSLFAMARAATEAIRESDPVSSIMVSFNNPLGEQQEVNPLAFSKRLKDAAVDYDIIGLQYLYNGLNREQMVVQNKRSLSAIAQSLNDFALLEKDIHITGVSVPSQSPSTGKNATGYWGRKWSPELQSVYMRAFYVLAYASPAVRAIVWKGATDGDSEVDFGGLMTRPGSTKASFHTLRELLTRWTSRGDAEVNGNGQLRFRGYAGQYHVVVTDLETRRQLVARAEIDEQELTKITITLPSELTHSEPPAEYDLDQQ